jgi:hypothetical protein
VRVQVRVVQGQEAGWTTELRGVRTSQATTYEPTMPPRPAATTCSQGSEAEECKYA